MTIADLIGADRVLLDLRAATKAQALRDLARRAAAALGLNQGAVLGAVLRREELGSTGLGKGFALPHARIPGLSAPFALFARLAKPIDFAAIDQRPVDLVVLLLTPANEANQHLSTLAAISRPMRDEAFVQRLRQARDAASVAAAMAEGGDR
ncbi:MAG TPA: PTS sugar transporter subunit IIA [Acetobacteraceae bacterium]|nr:PTS sugar transporter subunit IIA [Acetobacteraceae bacterium]